ncbi:MAG: hypothetical protein IPK19_34685 [Chloroflexi bacterium]|nr:hypothetical protein [Chloroflexota bacterium]
MSGRTERVLTMIMGLVLAIGAVIWIMITQTQSDFPNTRTPTRIPGPLPSLTADGAQGAIAPEPTSELTYFLIRYQAFEKGFMIQRIGEPCVFAYSTAENGRIVLSPFVTDGQLPSYAYCIPFEGLVDVAIPEPADDLLETNTPFRLVWGAYAPVRDALGLPVSASIGSQSALPPTPQVTDGLVSYTPIAYLPDGRLFECGTRGATSGNCRMAP